MTYTDLVGVVRGQLMSVELLRVHAPSVTLTTTPSLEHSTLKWTHLKIGWAEVGGHSRCFHSVSGQIVEKMRLRGNEIHFLVFTDVVDSVELLEICYPVRI